MLFYKRKISIHGLEIGEQNVKSIIAFATHTTMGQNQTKTFAKLSTMTKIILIYHIFLTLQ